MPSVTDFSHVAFLRAINVGGRRVTGAELRAVVEDAGYGPADTFLASGNVVFTAPGATVQVTDVESRLAAALETSLGYPVPAFVRDAADTRRLAAATPFEPSLLEASASAPQVGFVRDDIDDPHAAAALAPDGEYLRVGAREVFWLPASGFADSKLDMAALERLTGPITWRTANTVARIAAKFFSG